MSLNDRSERRLILGDCLDILYELPDACVNLIYIDPPFCSGHNYKDFEDRHVSTMAYIDHMRPRCEQLARVLKPTGSIYYHCDWHASHYVKVMLDQIFGENNFQNEIVWKRSRNRSSMSKIFRRAHDVLFFYTRSNNYTFNMNYKPLSEGSLELYKNTDKAGRRYQLVPLLVSGKRKGETGKVWRGIDPNEYGQSGMHWVTKPENLDKYESEGLVFWPAKEGGLPRLKYYLENNLGVPLSDVWDDIDLIHSSSSESMGYPTQKPVALLNRIVQVSSNPDDIVLDAFCGCGTALVAAQNLGRRWIGIDISATAIAIAESRLKGSEDCRNSAVADFPLFTEGGEPTGPDWELMFSR